MPSKSSAPPPVSLIFDLRHNAVDLIVELSECENAQCRENIADAFVIMTQFEVFLMIFFYFFLILCFSSLILCVF